MRTTPPVQGANNPPDNKTNPPIKKRAEHLNRHLSGDARMDNRHTKRRSASLLIRATHVEPTVRRRLTPVRLASITKTAAAGEDVGRRGPPRCGRVREPVQPLWETVWRVLDK